MKILQLVTFLLLVVLHVHGNFPIADFALYGLMAYYVIRFVARNTPNDDSHYPFLESR